MSPGIKHSDNTTRGNHIWCRDQRLERYLKLNEIHIISLRKMKSDINKAFLRAGVYDFLESSGQKDNYRLDITTAYKIEKHK